MKIRPMTVVLAVALAVTIVVTAGPLISGPRAEQIQHQNEDATAYIAAVKQQVVRNEAFSDFRMDLIRQGRRGGVINFHCSLASTNDQTEFSRLLRFRKSPYAVAGTVSFKDTTNNDWIMIAAPADP